MNLEKFLVYENTKSAKENNMLFLLMHTPFGCIYLIDNFVLFVDKVLLQ
jgi:hypothetical protein